MDARDIAADQRIFLVLLQEFVGREFELREEHLRSALRVVGIGDESPELEEIVFGEHDELHGVDLEHDAEFLRVVIGIVFRALKLNVVAHRIAEVGLCESGSVKVTSFLFVLTFGLSFSWEIILVILYLIDLI